ncbi:protein FAR-RED IMPAIRED RESPONSE 1-like [Henckelia pumila]|uniref:protein FAR-RED IMPAIRED RESPONSE 1-like n=1 Tax=Henckelia pumila TaxID=405737 RepID=UPI003C6E3A82
MQFVCPGFFFSLDLDDDGRLKNVFCADNRSRKAYKEFGDVVTFDTTYLTNKYDMPFALFIDTPQGIITDQDKAMQNAIEIVFPNTKHRWCLWHILKRLPEKFGYHSQKASILWSVHEFVYESQSADEYEQGWFSMLDMYELQYNDWLIELFRERSRLVPCFLITSFWAGMSTTQRIESMNGFFDGYVPSKTTLKQFVEQYEQALRSKVEKEFQARFKSFSQVVPCVTRFDMERQFQTDYTIVKFKEFQQELTGKMYCDLESTDEGSFGMRYVVTEDFTVHEKVKQKIFEIMFERDKCTFSVVTYLSLGE